jgi:serine/threonine-protein kinase
VRLGPAVVLVASILAASSGSSGARAEPTAAERAVAQTLFDEARTLVAASKFAEACPKLEESQRLDPAGGTLLHLAACYEGAGRLASAWSTFHGALSQALRDKRPDRAEVARARIAAIEPNLSKVAIDVPPEVASTKGLEVRRGDAVVGAGQFGTALPVDPGVIQIVVTAPGKRPFSRDVTVGNEPTVQRVAVPVLEDLPPEAAPSPAPPPKPKPVVLEQPPPDGEPQRIAGIVVGSLGLAIGAVGGVFGGLALARKGEAEDHCNEANLCDAEGIAIQEEGVTFGNVSTALIAVGGAALATGIIVFFTAPSSSSPASASAAISPNGARLTITW